MTEDRSAAAPVFRLAHGTAAAEVSANGAELARWSLAGRDLLWSGDPAHWGATAPVLFPVCGALSGGIARFGAMSVTMPVHGFAHAARFRPLAAADDMLVLELRDTPETRALYPFAFRLRVTFRLAAIGLVQRLELHNPGPAPLPHALGLHPGFAVPGGVAEIAFEAEEDPQVPVIEAGLISAARRPSGLEGRRLRLDRSSFAAGALCFLGAKGRALRLTRPDGHGIAIRYGGIAHLALWGRPGADFIALEGWTGHGDASGFAGDFAARPSTRWLVPGGTARLSALFRAF